MQNSIRVRGSKTRSVHRCYAVQNVLARLAGRTAKTNTVIAQSGIINSDSPQLVGYRWLRHWAKYQKKGCRPDVAPRLIEALLTSSAIYHHVKSPRSLIMRSPGVDCVSENDFASVCVRSGCLTKWGKENPQGPHFAMAGSLNPIGPV